VIYLLDTNVLLRLVRRSEPQHATVRNALRKLRRSQGHLIRTTAQNFAEFWNVSTRPVNQNGFGQSIDDAHHSLRLAAQSTAESVEKSNTVRRSCFPSSGCELIGVLPQSLEELDSRRVNILIGKQFHGAGVAT
jgi:predicted nucleic acid-binding protein